MSIKSVSVVFLLLTSLVTLSTAQQTDKVTKLLKIEPNTYNADRDSAFVDPYYGLTKLIYGNKRFAENKSLKPRQKDSNLKNSQSGQTPFATIVGCADSRVPNEIIFDQGVGDLFITRTAGQVMAEASFGTIEYATVVLKNKLIVVLGHESCGAVDAAMKLPKNPPGHVVTLINAIKPAALLAKKQTSDPNKALEIAVRENVLQQVNMLRNLEPVLSNQFADGEIIIVGAVYDLDSGQVIFLEETITSLPKFAKK